MIKLVASLPTLLICLVLSAGCGEVSKEIDAASPDAALDMSVTDLKPPDLSKPDAIPPDMQPDAPLLDMPEPDAILPDSSKAYDLPVLDSGPDQLQPIPDLPVPDLPVLDQYTPDQHLLDLLAPDAMPPDLGPPPVPVLLSGGISGTGPSSGSKFILIQGSFEKSGRLCVTGVGCVSGGIEP